MFLGIILSSRPGVASSKRHAGRREPEDASSWYSNHEDMKDRYIRYIQPYFSPWHKGSLNSGTASNIDNVCPLQCEHKYWNIRISAPAHYQWPECPGDWGWGPDKRPGAGHRIQPSTPRRPNINSFVSSWWNPPLRQHFWPSEQLVNNGPSRYYWAIIRIFSSNE